MDFDGLDEVDDIGAICVSRPTNPTGNVITDDEVARLGAVARARGVPLILDTAYGLPFPGLVFGESTPVWDEHTVVCMSLSKLGLPGFRTGIVIANEGETVEALAAATAIFCLSPGRLGPALGTELIAGGGLLPLVRDVIRPHYAARAARAVDRLRDGLHDYPIRVHKPEGAFFLWLWMPGLPITNAALYERLKQRDVIVVSGHYFFPGREDDDWPHKRECIRISYADDWERTQRGARHRCGGGCDGRTTAPPGAAPLDLSSVSTLPDRTLPVDRFVASAADSDPMNKLKLFVDGRFVDSSAGGIDVTDPATQEVLCEVPFATADEVDRAVQGAEGDLPDLARRADARAGAAAVRLPGHPEEEPGRHRPAPVPRYRQDLGGRAGRGLARHRGGGACLRHRVADDGRDGRERRPAASTPTALSSPSACAPASRRSTSRPWCRCGCSRWLSPAATPSC